MNPEVIFIFVVLAIINSIFNKNKVQKKQQQRRNQQMQNQENQQRPAQTKHRDSSEDYGLSERRKVSSSEKTEKTQSQQQKPRSLLEEVLQQYNINDEKTSTKTKEQTSKEVPVKTKETSNDEGHYTDYSNRDQPKKSRKKKEMKAYSKPRKKGAEAKKLSADFIEKTSVEKSEIGAEGFSELLKFDQQSLVRGIIMSEILEKPKSMRKNKAG